MAIGIAVVGVVGVAGWVVLRPSSVEPVLDPVADVDPARQAEQRISAGPKPVPPAGAPNVLLIVWDTVRADRLGTYGYDKPTTPHLDAFATRGVVFENAISPGVWTLPSHASLFTGVPVSAHGVGADHKWLDDDHDVVAEALVRVGYDTYAFSANPYMGEETNVLQGFETVQHPWLRQWKPAARAVMEAKLIDQDASTTVSPAWPKKASRSNNYLYKEAAPVASSAFRTWLGERDEPQRPWFAFINMMEAHLPRVPSMEAREKMMDADVIEHGFNVEQTSASFHSWMAGQVNLSGQDLEAISGIYDASLVDLDAATGALFEAMEQDGQLDNTIVIITSDHGEALGDHQLLLHKYSVYADLARVPLVVVAPGLLEPGRRSDLVSVADTFQIVSDMVKMPAPVHDVWEGGDRPEGTVVEFNAVAAHSIRVLRKDHPKADLSRFERTFRGIELGSEKLIVGSDGSRELYRYAEDRDETNNLYEAEPARAAELEAALQAWLASFDHFDPEQAQEHSTEISDELGEALQALGYLEGGELDEETPE